MLRISKLTDYGTVILAALATVPENEQITASDVADRTRIGLPTVSKLLKSLQRGGLVVSTRGSYGGYRLARPATQISAAAILDTLEGKLALTECSSQHSNCGIANTCRVGHAWQYVNLAIRRSLEDITLAQLAGFERVSMRSPSLIAPRVGEAPLVRMHKQT